MPRFRPHRRAKFPLFACQLKLRSTPRLVVVGGKPLPCKKNGDTINRELSVGFGSVGILLHLHGSKWAVE